MLETVLPRRAARCMLRPMSARFIYRVPWLWIRLPSARNRNIRVRISAGSKRESGRGSPAPNLSATPPRIRTLKGTFEAFNLLLARFESVDRYPLALKVQMSDHIAGPVHP